MHIFRAALELCLLVMNLGRIAGMAETHARFPIGRTRGSHPRRRRRTPRDAAYVHRQEGRRTPPENMHHQPRAAARRASRRASRPPHRRTRASGGRAVQTRRLSQRRMTGSHAAPTASWATRIPTMIIVGTPIRRPGSTSEPKPWPPTAGVAPSPGSKDATCVGVTEPIGPPTMGPADAAPDARGPELAPAVDGSGFTVDGADDV